jgi:Tol biopolymer transport system component
MRRTLFLLIAVLLAGAIPVTAQDGGDVDQLTVVSVTELDLLADTTNIYYYLTPDGERLAHLSRDGIGMYTTAGQQLSLIRIVKRIGRIVDFEAMRWSPDSRHIVVTENFWQSLAEPDIYVIDTTTGEISNLTDDQVDSLPIDEPDVSWDDIYIDVIPHWVDGGECILFVRYTRTGEDYNPPALMTIRPDGSDLTPIGTIEADDSFAITDVDWSPDGNFMAYVYISRDSPNNGVWLADVDGQNARRLGDFVYEAEDETISVPFAKVIFSADGQYVLACTKWISSPLSSIELNTKRQRSQASPWRVFSVVTGASLVLNDEFYVSGAGWSPDGHALAYLVTDRLAPDNSGLYISSGPGDPGRLVLPGLFYPSTSYQTQPLTWADNNTILLSRGAEPGILVVQLGIE